MNKKLPDKRQLAVRRYNLYEMRAEQDGGIVEGHAAVYDQAADIGGWFREIISPGAFDNADLSDVALLVNHNMDALPLARSRSGQNSSMQVKIDDKGLFISAKLDIENNMDARALLSAVQRRDITGMSFAFWIDDEEWSDMDTDYPTRTIHRISKVIEVSAVNDPAYESTDVAARSGRMDDKIALKRARAVEEKHDRVNKIKRRIRRKLHA